MRGVNANRNSILIIFHKSMIGKGNIIEVPPMSTPIKSSHTIEANGKRTVQTMT